MSLLEEILEYKRAEVRELRSDSSLQALKDKASKTAAPKNFAAALARPGLSIIAEIKKASPSRGILKPDLDPLSTAREYESGGAAALSVLTDRRFFHGDPSFLRDISPHSPLPVLRKDFLLDEVQVYESRVLGADAILLIVRILPPQKLKSLHRIATDLGMATLLEVHSESDIETANDLNVPIVGINNRNLDDFSVSLDHSLRLRPLVNPTSLLVSESGISTKDHARVLASAGFSAILVGEALIEAKDPVSLLRELSSV